MSNRLPSTSYTISVTSQIRHPKTHQRWILAIGALIIAAMVFGTALRPMLRRRRAQDMAGAVPQTATAIVTARFGANSNMVGESVRPWAQVRFQGRLYAAQTAINVEQLKEGQSAKITYRIGKSGRIYVDSVAPLSP